MKPLQITGLVGFIILAVLATFTISFAILSIFIPSLNIGIEYLLLIGIGLKANLKDARVHWILEISNIICQSSVAAGTILLFINFNPLETAFEE